MIPPNQHRLGIDHPVVSVRNHPAPDGSPDEAVVSLGMVMDTELGDASNFLCEQHRPEFIWRKDWQNHPNGANGVLEVVYVTRDLSLLEDRWAKLFGAGQTNRVYGHIEADTGCGRLVALTPQQAEERFSAVGLPVSYTDKPHGIALQVRVPDIIVAKRVLAENGVRHAETAEGVAVTPDSAGNTIIEFAQAG